MFLILSMLGFFDSVYLTIAHYKSLTVPCQIAHGCERVLTSSYAEIMGVPIALLGAGFYLALIFLITYIMQRLSKHLAMILSIITFLGFFYSAYLVYLQGFIIKAFCQYCLLSELITTLLLGVLFLREKVKNEKED